MAWRKGIRESTQERLLESMDIRDIETNDILVLHLDKSSRLPNYGYPFGQKLEVKVMSVARKRVNIEFYTADGKKLNRWLSPKVLWRV